MKTKNSKIANNISPPIATLFYTSPQILNMKKTTLVIVAAALISSNVNSQITKHNWLLGGNTGYTHTNNNSSLTLCIRTVQFHCHQILDILFGISFVRASNFQFFYIRMTFPQIQEQV